MQAFIEDQFLKIIHLLQRYDTALGIAIDQQQTRLVKIRRRWNGYDIEGVSTLQVPLAELTAETLEAYVDKKGLASTTVVAGLPQLPGILERKVEVPLHHADDIDAFLFSNENGILPPGIDRSDIAVRYRILGIDESALRLQVFLYREYQLETYKELLAPLEPQLILYSIPGLEVLEEPDEQPSEYEHAFKLAVSAFAEPLDPASMMDQVSRGEAEQRFWKHLTLKSTLVLGVVIICATLIIFAAQGVVNWQYARYETAVNDIRPLMASRDSLQIVQASAQKLHEKYSALKSQRSYAGFYLHEICRGLPPQTWFHKIEADLTDSKKQDRRLSLKGLSRDKTQIAKLLGEIERLPFAGGITLEGMTVLDRKTLWRRHKIKAPQLIEFEIKLYVKS